MGSRPANTGLNFSNGPVTLADELPVKAKTTKIFVT